MYMHICIHTYVYIHWYMFGPIAKLFSYLVHVRANGKIIQLFGTFPGQWLNYSVIWYMSGPMAKLFSYLVHVRANG
jgi:hypothetical protein